MLQLSEWPQPRSAPTARAEEHLSRLVLTGFMGAGKSTVGPIVAESLGWEFLDVDRVVEAACAQTVEEIFRERGEAYFRTQEREAVARLLQADRVVIALGGGAIEDPITRSSLLRSPAATCLVFLDAPMPELLARLRHAPEARPLLRDAEDLAARHERRLPYYRAAHLTILTAGLTPREVAVRILDGAEEGWILERRPSSAEPNPAEG